MPGLSIRKRLARGVSTVVPEMVEKFVLAKRFFADIERTQFEIFSHRYDLYEFTNRTYYRGQGRHSHTIQTAGALDLLRLPKRDVG